MFENPKLRIKKENLYDFNVENLWLDLDNPMSHLSSASIKFHFRSDYSK